MNPILPDLVDGLHRQWRAYSGFSFAFKDYMEIDLISYIDNPWFNEGFNTIDPIQYGE